MNWYRYIACFFAGMSLISVVSPFVQSISDDRFLTPFAQPRGKGLSLSTLSIVWALLNPIVCYILIRVGKVSGEENSAVVIFFAGIVVMSTALSVRFAKKQD